MIEDNNRTLAEIKENILKQNSIIQTTNDRVNTSFSEVHRVIDEEKRRF